MAAFTVKCCVGVCAVDDGMLMEVSDECRLDWAFELDSGSNTRGTMSGETHGEGGALSSVIAMLFYPDGRGSENDFPFRLLYVGES